MRRAFATLAATALLFGGCGGGDDSEADSRPSLPPAEDRVVGTVFRELDGDLRQVRKLSEAYDLSGPTQEGTIFRQLRLRLRRNVGRLIDRLADERASARVPSAGGKTVAALLGETADRVRPQSKALAAELRRARRGLIP